MLIDRPITEIQPSQNLTFKIQGQDHGWSSKFKVGPTSYRCPPLSTLPFLRHGFFKIWPLKYKVNVMDEIKIQSHKVDLTSCGLTPLLFHVNRSSNSWDTTFFKIHPFCFMLMNPPVTEIHLFQNLTFKIQGQCHRTGKSSKPQSVSHFLSICIPFVLCQSALLFLRYGFFNLWPWKSKVKVIIHNIAQLQV